MLFYAGHQLSHTHRAAEELFAGAFLARGHAPFTLSSDAKPSQPAQRGTTGKPTVPPVPPARARATPKRPHQWRQVCFPGAEQQMALSAAPWRRAGSRGGHRRRRNLCLGSAPCQPGTARNGPVMLTHKGKYSSRRRTHVQYHSRNFQ